MRRTEEQNKVRKNIPAEDDKGGGLQFTGDHKDRGMYLTCGHKDGGMDELTCGHKGGGEHRVG